MTSNEINSHQPSFVKFDQIDPMEYRAILVDLDDTLYQYKPCHDKALLACFESHRFGLSFAKFRKLYRSARTFVTEQLEPQASCRSRLLAFQKLMEDMHYPAAYELALTLEEIYWTTFIDTMVLDPNADAFLERCVTNYIPVCIVTDMTATIQIRKIKRLGIAEYISHLVTSEEVGVEKPDRRMFAAAIAKVGVDKKSCLMLGDHYYKDVRGARSAGLAAHLINLYI